MLQVGQKVRHPVNNPMYGQTFNGCLYGIVKQVFDNGSYRLTTKSNEVVMRDSSVAIPIDDEEFNSIIHTAPQSTTTHSGPVTKTETKVIEQKQPKEKVVRSKPVNGEPTKRDKAEALYKQMVASGVPFTRNDLKKAFQDQIGLTVAGSSTYSYYFM